MRIAVSLLLAILLGVFCFISNDVMVKSAEKTTRYVEDVESAVKEGNFNLAEKRYKKAKDYWERKEKILSFFISHKSLDEISLSLGKIEATIKKDEETLFFYQVTELDILLKRIKNINSLSFEHLV